eukprot:Hpha_TRINITY_DN12193_c0_g1::TRINITY_DN12193_c0_g1_i1::g.81881::m.81881/K15789/TDH; threonine 3-dehydrogenase
MQRVAQLSQRFASVARPQFVVSSIPRRAVAADLQRRMMHTTKEGRRPRVLITGCLGQVGTALVRLLRFHYGASNVIASDVVIPSREFYRDGPFVYVDVTQYNTLAKIVVDEGIDWIIHNTSLQSITGEYDPKRAMDVHITGIRNVLELARNLNLLVLAPSSHAVFGPESGLEGTPDLTVQRPRTIYGVTKCFTENIGMYFHRKYGVDFRCLRYPGIISTLEEGSAPARHLYRPTTDDYPILSFHNLREGRCRDGEPMDIGLTPHMKLPYLYIDDCLTATEALLEADSDSLKKRIYNVQSCSFTPQQFEHEVQKYLPSFKFNYKTDYRNNIAKDWPDSLDDSAFRNDFQWEAQYQLEEIVPTMLRRMGIIHATPGRTTGRKTPEKGKQKGKQDLGIKMATNA